jgi:hypothetical protein
MTCIWTLCAWIAWTPSEGALGHRFWEDDLPPIIAFDEQMEVCRVDWDVPHVYRVSGFDDENEGVLSDPLTVIWPLPEPGVNQMLLSGVTLLAWLRRRVIHQARHPA